MIQILKTISTKDITLLKHVNDTIILNKNGKFKHFYLLNCSKARLLDFLASLDNESLYTMIPLISMNGSDNDPQIILSKQILVTNLSSPIVIHDFLSTKIEQAIFDFGITNLENNLPFYIVIKFKKLTFDFSKLA
jgi:hypothetical protein